MSTRVSTPEELNRLLSECCERLVDCTSAIKDLPLANYRENIYRIGKAIAEVSEVRSELYRAHPHLKPDGWDRPPSEKDFAEWFAEAQQVANEYCAEGVPQRAIDTYESLISIGAPEKYVALASEAIKLIRAKHGV
jgi:hypothetical protein